jgi:signal transduction histidine kinase
MANLRKTLAWCGAAGPLVEAFDWSATPLGPLAEWPPHLACAVELVLACGFPLSAVVGGDPSQARVIYNDAFVAFLGDKHPAAMGGRAREVWPETWDFFEWALRQVRQTGRPVTGKDILLRIDRNGRLEDVYASVSFSPIWDDRGDLHGSLVCCLETTAEVVRRRREHALREMADCLGKARTEDELHCAVESALSAVAKDVAFALLYVIDPERQRASLRAAAGLESDAPAALREVDLGAGAAGPWEIASVARAGEMRVVAPGDVRLSALASLNGRPGSAAVVPVTLAAQESPLGVLVVGLSPSQAFDDAYEGFVRLVADQIAASLASVRRLQEARHRADACAELHRAKTMFLTNVSHEFRTPLTLVLGPAEDLLADADEPLSPEHRAQVEHIVRNANRLLRYVNALLEFARTDTGRAAVVYEPTDLADFTRRIMDAFEPLVLRAGLRLVVDCPPASEPVFVARDMWEEIVCNLLSNALKFTFAGEIAVSLRLLPEHVALVVRDTGVGIPADAVPHLFERFYRVPEARARTREGLGIGLALVKDLVELHKGSIRVGSAPGEGTAFTVEIPRGAAHLPVDQVRETPSPVATPRHATPFVEDARGWPVGPRCGVAARASPRDTAPRPPPGPERVAAGRILVAEDSDDMRDYLVRLLGSIYDVEAVADGAAALASVRRRPPDFILSDVLMPEIDGLELLRALREDPATCDIPVALLSARGEEDVIVDALARGADDYLVKPFSARELRARVRTHLELARARREAGESRLKDMFLGLASHELRTPLTCLKLNVQLVHRQVEAVDPRLASRLAGLHRSINRMARLVDEMLSISAISAGKLTLRPTRCDLCEICRSAATEQVQLTGRELGLDLPGAPVHALVDEDRVFQVVENLLSNALKYSAADRPVTLALRTSAREATVTVRDRGAGIPPDSLPHVFERFYRAPHVDVQAGSYVGLGLGLFLSKAIVEQHTGRIWVESAVGEGSAFSFTMPLAA